MPPPSTDLPPPSRSRVLIPILGVLSAFGPMSTDMYLPSLPAIAADFAASTSQVQLTLSAFFLGFAGGQLVYGPLSDRFGRRPVLLTGIALYTVTSLLCALSPGIGWMIAGRLFQAMGGGAGSVIARAIVRDRFGASQASRVLSNMVLVMAIAPLAAPLVGGQVLLWLGWRAIFWVLTGFGALVLAAAAWGIPESHPAERRAPLPLAGMLRAFGRVLRHRQAAGCILTGGFAFAGMFAYIAGTPFVYIQLFGISPQAYGFLFGLNVVGLMLGAYVNGRVVVRLGAGSLLAMGSALIFLAGLALLCTAASGWGGLVGIVVPLFCYMTTLQLVAANAVARALHYFPEIAGTASALFGACQFGLGALAALLVALLHDGTALPMAAVIAGAAALSLAAERLLARE